MKNPPPHDATRAPSRAIGHRLSLPWMEDDGVGEMSPSTATMPYHDGVSRPVNPCYHQQNRPRRSRSLGLWRNRHAHPESGKSLQNHPENYQYGPGFVRVWPSRDPIGEDGGINLYGMVGNDGVNHFDVLGLEKEMCYVVIDMAHTGSWSFESPEKFPKCTSYAVLGCLERTDQLNDKLVKAGKGVPNMPRTNGEYFGPGTHDYFDPSKELTDEDINGKYGVGREEYNKFMTDAWNAALKRGEWMCKSKKCECDCKEVMVHIFCNNIPEKERKGFGDWCGKQKTLKCEEL